MATSTSVFRYSLRTLFLAMGVFAVLSARIGAVSTLANTRRRAISEIEQSGGVVAFVKPKRPVVDSASLWLASCFVGTESLNAVDSLNVGRSPEHRALAQLRHEGRDSASRDTAPLRTKSAIGEWIERFSELRSLGVAGERISNEDVQRFSLLDELEELCLRECDLANVSVPLRQKSDSLRIVRLLDCNGADGRFYGQVMSLRELRVRNRDSSTDHRAEELGNACEVWQFGAIARMRELEVLELSDVPIGDNDLEWLSGMTFLKELDISGSSVTGRGLKKLSPLTSLELLVLEREGRHVHAISDEDVESLRAEHPTLIVHYFSRAGLSP